MVGLLDRPLVSLDLTRLVPQEVLQAHQPRLKMLSDYRLLLRLDLSRVLGGLPTILSGKLGILDLLPQQLVLCLNQEIPLGEFGPLLLTGDVSLLL